VLIRWTGFWPLMVVWHDGVAWFGVLEGTVGRGIKRRVICENGSHIYVGDVTCGEKKLRLV
jgi:hypothetical protein